MNCCQCQGIEELFNDRLVSEELSNYRVKGPNQTTRILIDALKKQANGGISLLDIGGGVGAIQHHLLDAGVQNATDVDASRAYLRAAKEEAERRGIADRVDFQHGNFVEIADQIAPADIVTLDRVICCYPDMEKLVSLSSARARHLYGVVFPRDAWWIKIGLSMMNFIFRLQKNPFRIFAHPTDRVDGLVTAAGLKRQFYRRTFFWQVIVYAR